MTIRPIAPAKPLRVRRAISSASAARSSRSAWTRTLISSWLSRPRSISRTAPALRPSRPTWTSGLSAWARPRRRLRSAAVSSRWVGGGPAAAGLGVSGFFFFFFELMPGSSACARRVAVVRQPARSVGGAHRAIVAEGHENEQDLFDRAPPPGSFGEERRRSRIERHHVGIVSGLERSDAVPQPERSRPTQRGEIERLRGRELGAGQLRHLVGLVEGLQEREAGAGADVRAEPDLHRPARILGAGQAKQAATEEEVRRRTVCDRGAAPMDAAELARREMDAVGEHRAAAHQSVMLVDVEVVTPAREET